MKTKKNQKKLSLQKETIARLNSVEMSQVYGQRDLNVILSKIFTDCNGDNELAAVAVAEDDIGDYRPTSPCQEK